MVMLPLPATIFSLKSITISLLAVTLVALSFGVELAPSNVGAAVSTVNAVIANGVLVLPAASWTVIVQSL